ncbi:MULTISPECIES: hypothetical protein [unclassified Mycobacteroides]|uniref:hypothetical protein n=1 Tax=unclassified Mycobacteroides TaxID=2618759 RepID=UPI0012DC002C|nr:MULTISPECIES: hypothetical protein [unclassified Mycobacteroides]
MKVAPNSAVGTPGMSAGSAMSTACGPSADTNTMGRDQCLLSHISSTAEGAAARPTKSHAPLPNQPGPGTKSGLRRHQRQDGGMGEPADAHRRRGLRDMPHGVASGR